MRNVLALLLLAVGLASVESAAADPQAGTSSVRTELRREGDTWRFVIHLDQARDVVSFDTSAGSLRAENWVGPEGVVFRENEVRRADGQKLREMSFAIRPDARGYDRLYPALIQAGEGVVFFGPYLRVTGSDPSDRIEVPAGWIIEAGDDEAVSIGNGAYRVALRGYVYVGPPASRKGTVATVLGGSRVPKWLNEAVSESVETSTAYYARRLGVKLLRPPVIVLSHMADGEQPSWRGDVTRNGVLSLRFYGSGWSSESEPLRHELRHFVAHEIFHFWNGRQFAQADAKQRPWVFEGAAEYAAELFELSQSHARSAPGEFNRRLDACKRQLGSAALDDEEARRGMLVYDCGYVLQKIEAAGIRSKTNPPADGLSIWAALFAGKAPGSSYASEDALFPKRQKSGAALDAIRQLVSTRGTERWIAIDRDLEALALR